MSKKKLSRDEALDLLSQQGFDRIRQSIEILWGEPHLDRYMSSLIISNRDDRDGFPHSVFRAIMRLYHLHHHELVEAGKVADLEGWDGVVA